MELSPCKVADLKLRPAHNDIFVLLELMAKEVGTKESKKGEGLRRGGRGVLLRPEESERAGRESQGGGKDERERRSSAAGHHASGTAYYSHPLE